MKTPLFVYGTLKTGFHNNRLLGSVPFIGQGVTKLKWPMLVQGIPFVINKPGVGARITGEIFGPVPASVMATLDALEGHPDWYKRTLIQVEATLYKSTVSQVLDCWCYIIGLDKVRANLDSTAKLYSTYEMGH